MPRWICMSTLPIKPSLPGFSHRLGVQSVAASLKFYWSIIRDSGCSSNELMTYCYHPPTPNPFRLKPSVPPVSVLRCGFLPRVQQRTCATKRFCVLSLIPGVSLKVSASLTSFYILQLRHNVWHETTRRWESWHEREATLKVIAPYMQAPLLLKVVVTCKHFTISIVMW